MDLLSLQLHAVNNIVLLSRGKWHALTYLTPTVASIQCTGSYHQRRSHHIPMHCTILRQMVNKSLRDEL